MFAFHYIRFGSVCIVLTAFFYEHKKKKATKGSSGAWLMKQSTNVLYLNAFRFFSIHASLFIMQHSIVLSINSMVWLCSFHTINSNQHLDTYSITSVYIQCSPSVSVKTMHTWAKHEITLIKMNACQRHHRFSSGYHRMSVGFSFIRLEGVWNSAFFSPGLIDLRTRLLLNTKHLFNIQITVNSSQQQTRVVFKLAQIFWNMTRFERIFLVSSLWIIYFYFFIVKSLEKILRENKHNINANIFVVFTSYLRRIFTMWPVQLHLFGLWHLNQKMTEDTMLFSAFSLMLKKVIDSCSHRYPLKLSCITFPNG